MKPILLALLVLSLLTLLPASAEEAAAKKYHAYFGTYTRGTKSQGIYRAEFDPATGKLGAPEVAVKTDNPTFLALHPTGKFLYAVGEVADFDKKTKGGAINAFAIDDKGGLTFLNGASSGGGGPCHVSVDKSGKFVLGANYGGGSACVLPIGDDGKVGKATGFVQHTGKRTHAHAINLDPANNFAFVNDLGLDKVLVYKFDKGTGQITLNDPPAGLLKAGAGPRHFAFHPSGSFAYVNNEQDSTVTAFAYDAAAGKLTEIHTLPTLPKPHKGNSTAEVVVHPNGKSLYVSNRGHNSIAQFTLDPKTGRMTANGHQGEGIKVPRNFALDPTGKWCVVCNQDGDSAIVFKVGDGGKLETTDVKIAVPRPVCVRFLAVKE